MRTHRGQEREDNGRATSGRGNNTSGRAHIPGSMKGVLICSSFWLAVASVGMATFALRVLVKESAYDEQTGAGGLA